MYSIGRFSKLTGIKVKTLVWYDNIGLLKPESVNRENGYRYYGIENFKEVLNIQFWQSMGFSIDEIKNMSGEVINKKLGELQSKIDFIQNNINLLEENKGMEVFSIFDISQMMLFGKWEYKGTNTNFKDMISSKTNSKLDKNIPQFLFFGERNLATDLREIFGFDSTGFVLSYGNKSKSFSYFMLNNNQTLVLYEKPLENTDKPTKTAFHIFDRENEKRYSSKEIQYIFNKSQKLTDLKSLSVNLIGKWEMIDEIFESEIEKYNGKIKTANVSFTLSPLFDVLEICDDGVYVLEDNETLELNNKILNHKNTKLPIYSTKDESQFVIENYLIDKQHKGKYKQIGNEEFLFVNLRFSPDLDEEVFVFKKEK